MSKILQKNREDFDWKKIWQTLHNSKVSYKIQSTLWTQINKTYYTNYLKNKYYQNHDPTCTYCGQAETEQHHLLYCDTTRKVWEKFNKIVLNG